MIRSTPGADRPRSGSLPENEKKGRRRVRARPRGSALGQAPDGGGEIHRLAISHVVSPSAATPVAAGAGPLRAGPALVNRQGLQSIARTKTRSTGCTNSVSVNLVERRCRQVLGCDNFKARGTEL